MGNQRGQAIVEFILMLSLALVIFAVMQAGFQRIRNRLWMDMSCQVSAPCPGCKADDAVLSNAQRRAPGSCRINR